MLGGFSIGLEEGFQYNNRQIQGAASLKWLDMKEREYCSEL